MKLTGPAFAGALAAGLLILAGPALAQPQGAPGAAEARQRLVPLSRVLEEIRHRTPGRQLDASVDQQGGRQVYKVEWMTTDGRRIDYVVDAMTGAILSGG